MSHPTFSKIAVMGAGAIGCYFGGMLARSGVAVALVARPSHVAAINRDGLRLQSLEFDEHIRLAATDSAAGVAGAQLVLFCVKSADTEDATRQMAPHLSPDAVILSLQNGVDNAERIRRHVGNRVFPVLVYAAATMPGPGHVQHTGGGYLVIGPSRESAGDAKAREWLNELAKFFSTAKVPMRVSDSVEAELWTKLVLNCAYNAVSALGAAPYSRLVAMPEVREVMQGVVDETVQIARAKGITLPNDILDTTFKLAAVMPQTFSSTAQDIQKGKRTEIDHLNGFLVRQGEAHGIATPFNRTLNALVKLLEQTKASPSS
jgi:2-dehydropantoate 2-reductase